MDMIRRTSHYIKAALSGNAALERILYVAMQR